MCDDSHEVCVKLDKMCKISNMLYKFV